MTATSPARRPPIRATGTTTRTTTSATSPAAPPRRLAKYQNTNQNSAVPFLLQQICSITEIREFIQYSHACRLGVAAVDTLYVADYVHFVFQALEGVKETLHGMKETLTGVKEVRAVEDDCLASCAKHWRPDLSSHAAKVLSSFDEQRRLSCLCC